MQENEPDKNSDKERYDRYAAELTTRFEDLVQWALTHWPRQDLPLMHSDFDAARREVAEIAGPRLGEPDESGQVPDPPGLAPERKGQYRDMNPMPWP
jgi:hypothetical protein